LPFIPPTSLSIIAAPLIAFWADIKIFFFFEVGPILFLAMTASSYEFIIFF